LKKSNTLNSAAVAPIFIVHPAPHIVDGDCDDSNKILKEYNVVVTSLDMNLTSCLVS
jgi:hypothetical protein